MGVVVDIEYWTPIMFWNQVRVVSGYFSQFVTHYFILSTVQEVTKQINHTRF